MARKKNVTFEEQVYRLAEYGATVTIRYDVTNPPPFFQPASGVVIVGQHECSPRPAFTRYDTPRGDESRHVARGGNIGFDEDDPNYKRMKDSLAGRTAAEPGVSPAVYTTEDAFRDMGVNLGGEQLDLHALAMMASNSEPVE